MQKILSFNWKYSLLGGHLPKILEFEHDVIFLEVFFFFWSVKFSLFWLSIRLSLLSVASRKQRGCEVD